MDHLRSGDQEDEEDDAFVRELQDHVVGVLLAHAPECAGVLGELREKGDGPTGIYLLLMEFGGEFLLPELAREKRATDVVRRVFVAVEELLADDEVIAEAAYFGTIEPLGVAVHHLTPEDVGPRVAREIKSTYPGWESPNMRNS